MTRVIVSMVDAGWTTKQIADKTGVAYNTVLRWLDKAGEERPTKQTYIPRNSTNGDRLAFGAGPQDPTTGCIPWLRCTSSKGYGQLAPNDERRLIGAHHLALEIKLDRRLLPGEVTRHACDNPPCINPDHLEVGSYAQNARDMADRGRQWMQKRYNSPEQISLRAKALTMLAQGSTSENVANKLGVSPRTVRLWSANRKYT